MQIQLPPLVPVHVFVVESEPSPWYLQPDYWIAIVMLVLAVAIICLAICTYRLFADTREGLMDAQRGLEIAERNAEAARRTAEVAQDFRQRTLCAYISVSVGRSSGNHGIVANSAVITLKNVGPTPSVQTTLFSNAIYTHEIPQSLSSLPLEERPCGVLGRDEVREFIAPIALSVADLASISKRVGHLILFGVVRYADVVSDRKRETAFCFEWMYPGSGDFRAFGPLNIVS